MKKYLILFSFVFSIFVFSDNNTYIYGYLTDFTTFNIENNRFGNTTYLRLKSDFSVEDNVGFHIELSYTYSIGDQNYYALLDNWGISTNQNYYPYTNFTEGFNFDHFYGSVNFDAFDFRFGKLPIGWGTGYVFNPTSRTYIMQFMNFVAEETPGTYAFVPSISINDNNSINMYFAFQDKTHKISAYIVDGDPNNIPFGIKYYTVLGQYDLSLSFIKEIIFNNGYSRNYFIGCDMAGVLWNFGIYLEGVYNFAKDSINDFNKDSIDFWNKTEFVAGFDYDLPLDITMRCEYFHQGSGEKNYFNYNIMDLFNYSRLLLAQDYLTVYMNKRFFDFHKLNFGIFSNLNDHSMIIFPTYNYNIYSNVQLSFGALIYTGDNGSEFNGEFNIASIIHLDYTHNTLYAKCKVSF